MNPAEIYYYLFIISVNRSNGSYNTVEDPFDRICGYFRAEDRDLKIFNVIKGINESKALAKHISCECRCEFDGRKCNSIQKQNYDECQNECKKKQKHRASENNYAWSP